jgi:hypothetical protein
MSIFRDILRKLRVRGVERQPGIAPIETAAGISQIFRNDAQRQLSDSLRRPPITNNAAELLGRQE